MMSRFSRYCCPTIALDTSAVIAWTTTLSRSIRSLIALISSVWIAISPPGDNGLGPRQPGPAGRGARGYRGELAPRRPRCARGVGTENPRSPRRDGARGAGSSPELLRDRAIVDLAP